MTVYIYDEDAFEKMVIVEGEHYREFRSREMFGESSFEAFSETWKRETDENPSLKEKAKDISLSNGEVGAIYGYGGVHRYIVNYSGEIIFLEQQGSPAYTEIAKKVGFNTFQQSFS